MTPALTLLIASSAAWNAPEARPTRLEVELLVAAFEQAVISETMDASSAGLVDVTGLPAVAPLSSLPSPLPVLHDFRSAITYTLTLPWVRTKP